MAAWCEKEGRTRLGRSRGQALVCHCVGVQVAKEVLGKCQALACATREAGAVPKDRGQPREQVQGRAGGCVGTGGTGCRKSLGTGIERRAKGTTRGTVGCASIFQKEGWNLVTVALTAGKGL